MKQDRIRWNEKYLKGTTATDPSEIVIRFCGVDPKGKALDIAAGTGRNALYLADQGYDVDAVDISEVGLKHLAGKHPRVSPICMDLDRFDIPQNRYRLIINIRYLNRRLFPLIREGLVPGGILIFESYIDVPGQDNRHFSCRDYLLRENELLHSFLSMHIVFYQETFEKSEEDRRIASLVAIKK